MYDYNEFLALYNHLKITPLFTLTLSCVLIYIYLTRHFGFWKKKDVKGPTPLPLFGNMLEHFFKTGHQVENERYKKYGKIYGIYLGNSPCIYVAEPELLRNIMVKDWNTFIYRNLQIINIKILSNMITAIGGDDWKRVRSILSPSFTSSKIRKMFAMIDDCTKNVLKRLDEAVKENVDVDLNKLYGAYSMDVIATVAFATKTDSGGDPNNVFVKNAKTFFSIKLLRIIPVFLFPKIILEIFNYNFFDKRMIDFFVSLTNTLMETRKNSKVEYHDFFQLMIDAEKKENIIDDIKDINQAHFQSETIDEIEENAKDLLNFKIREKSLSKDEILAQSLLFFVAGYETTAATLSLASYLLAVNPDIQEKLSSEIKIHQEKFGEINSENINEMKYLHAVISETLRLYPPAITTERAAKVDYDLGDTGIVIPKNTLVRIPIHAMHHDPENFPEPEKFKPERFLPENIDQIKPYTYMPFGAGPRNCIGMRLALLEAKLLLAKILSQYRFVKSEKTELKFTKYGIIPLIKTYPIFVKIEKRL